MNEIVQVFISMLLFSSNSFANSCDLKKVQKIMPTFSGTEQIKAVFPQLTGVAMKPTKKVGYIISTGEKCSLTYYDIKSGKVTSYEKLELLKNDYPICSRQGVYDSILKLSSIISDQDFGKPKGNVFQYPDAYKFRYSIGSEYCSSLAEVKIKSCVGYCKGWFDENPSKFCKLEAIAERKKLDVKNCEVCCENSN